MAVEQSLQTIDLLAGADLSAYQYHFVYVSAANTVSLAATAGMNALGVLLDEPAASGRSAKIAIGGRVKVVAGASISAGADVAVQVTTGHAVTATTGDYVMGKALTGASTNDLVAICLRDAGKDVIDYISLVAADSYSAKQYYLGVVDSAGKIALPTVEGQEWHGVVVTATGAGSTATVQVLGHCDAVAGAAVTKGDRLMTDSSGRVIPVTTGLYAGAIALETASIAGDVIDVLLLPSRPVKGAGAPNYFTISAVKASTVGTCTIVEDFEMPAKFTVLRGYAKVQTAPGSGKACTVTITDGSTPKTVVISGTATKGENETINTSYAANTDIDISAVDDGSGADLVVHFVCQMAE